MTLGHSFLGLVLGALAAPVAARANEESPAAAPLKVEPEVRVHQVEEGGVRVSVSGRNLPATAYLAQLAKLPNVRIVVDSPAEVPLKTTVLTVDLREREIDYVVELLGAAAGVDVIPQGALDSFRLEGPTLSLAGSRRDAVRRAAARFFEMALVRQRDAEVASSALRGLADLHREAKDFTGAYTVYETLLSRYPNSIHAADAELHLADCLAEVGDAYRANRVLRAFLDRCDDEATRERALARLLELLLDANRFMDIEDLRASLLEMPVLGERTVHRMADAATGMIEVGRPEAAVLFLEELFTVDPAGRAALGPPLALALILLGDEEKARQVLAVSAAHVRSIVDSATACTAFAELARRAGKNVEAFVFAVVALKNRDAGRSVRLRSNLLLADLYHELGLIGRARAHGQEASSQSPSADAGQFALDAAELALDEGQPELARLLFQEALKHRGAETEAEFGIARSLLAVGDTERARRLVERMGDDVELPAELRERAVLLEVECLEKLGRYREALELLASLTPAEPSAKATVERGS